MMIFTFMNPLIWLRTIVRDANLGLFVIAVSFDRRLDRLLLVAYLDLVLETAARLRMIE